MTTSRAIPLFIGSFVLAGSAQALGADAEVRCTVEKQTYSFNPIRTDPRASELNALRAKYGDAYMKVDDSQKLSSQQRSSVFRCGDSQFIKLSELTGDTSFKTVGTLFHKSGLGT